MVAALERVTLNQLELSQAVSNLQKGSGKENKENKTNIAGQDDEFKQKIKSILSANGFKSKKPKTELKILQDKLKTIEKKFKAASNNGGGRSNQGRGYRKPERKSTSG